MVTEGLVLVKFWLHISGHGQLRRFRARERDPLKRWKLTDEDWRDRSHRADYEEGAGEMLANTDHSAAGWHVVAGESKPYASVKVLEIVIAALEDALRSVGQEPVQAAAAL